MSKIRKVLSTNPGRIYVYLADRDVCEQFLRDAEKEGFLFTDGTKPTQKHTSDLIAVNSDLTINYVGFIGRAAYQAANEIGNQPLVKIDYRDILKQAE